MLVFEQVGEPFTPQNVAALRFAGNPDAPRRDKHTPCIKTNRLKNAIFFLLFSIGGFFFFISSCEICFCFFGVHTPFPTHLQHLFTTLNTMVDRLFELQSKQIESSPVLASLIAEKSKTDKALDNLVTAVENGLMSNTSNKRLRELEQLQQEFEEKIAIEKSKQQITFSKEELNAFYIDNLKNDPQILIDNVVHKVVLYDDSVTIFFNSSINIGLDESQGFLFYEKKHHIDSKKYRYAKIERIPIIVKAMI